MEQNNKPGEATKSFFDRVVSGKYNLRIFIAFVVFTLIYSYQVHHNRETVVNDYVLVEHRAAVDQFYGWVPQNSKRPMTSTYNECMAAGAADGRDWNEGVNADNAKHHTSYSNELTYECREVQ